MHAPSVGEGLQAEPVLKLFRARRPDVQLAYTFYSPSAESFAKGLDVDFADYLPFDTIRDTAAAIDSLSPNALVFSKLDVWPTLVDVANKKSVRLGVVSATLADASGRRGRFAQSLLSGAYASLDMVGAISAQDGARLVEQGVRSQCVRVTGDTRYDQVWARSLRAALHPLVQSLKSSRPTLVAGSTWPADEARLLRAWKRVAVSVPGVRLVIAPHEITPEHLTGIRTWARSAGLRLCDDDDAGAASADVVLVTRYGVLGDLYALADVAYVGGGFHRAGIHSVLEPAAFGAPVLFGPRHLSNADAEPLLRRGGGAVVRNEDDLHRRLGSWLTTDPTRSAAGEAARRMVRDGLGAAERSFELVSALVGPS